MSILSLYPQKKASDTKELETDNLNKDVAYAFKDYMSMVEENDSSSEHSLITDIKLLFEEDDENLEEHYLCAGDASSAYVLHSIEKEIQNQEISIWTLAAENLSNIDKDVDSDFYALNISEYVSVAPTKQEIDLFRKGRINMIKGRFKSWDEIKERDRDELLGLSDAKVRKANEKEIASFKKGRQNKENGNFKSWEDIREG